MGTAYYNGPQNLVHTHVSYTSVRCASTQKREILIEREICTEGAEEPDTWVHLNCRALDTVFVERLGRSVKIEKVYTHEYVTLADTRQNLDRYFRFSNDARLHQSLAYCTPASVYQCREASPTLS